MMNTSTNNLAKSIKDNWLILAFIVSVIVTWTNFINTDAKADARLIKLEETAMSDKTIQTQILTQLSQIQTDLQWIKTQLK